MQLRLIQTRVVIFRRTPNEERPLLELLLERNSAGLMRNLLAHRHITGRQAAFCQLLATPRPKLSVTFLMRHCVGDALASSVVFLQSPSSPAYQSSLGHITLRISSHMA